MSLWLPIDMYLCGAGIVGSCALAWGGTVAGVVGLLVFVGLLVVTMIVGRNE